MELRVWVDGTQRVVCGVKLTTTCQEIVFALAHATQQAGRFTMIERWRNNERLLSPNEQPLVTLQRWGDHMNEVEFILRKASTDLPANNQQPLNPAQQRPHYTDDQILNNSTNSSSRLRPHNPHNGYQIHSETPLQPKITNQPQADQQAQVSNNYPFEELYSTINKKRNNQPPAVPAKPPVTMSHQQIQPVVNNAQMNFYHPNQSPLNMYQPNNIRPRHPPGYLDYIEAITNRNSLAHQPMLSNGPNYAQALCSSSSLVINRGSAVNVKLTSNSQNNLPSARSIAGSDRSETSSVAQMGHDMLKVIEEQKKVLINQKNELDRLDNDQEYWETKQNSEQTELINRIESEILQLEKLWKENQTQIQKLENQDFEKELWDLKSEQMRMKLEIDKQKHKLTRFEKDIVQCKNKIEQLEAEQLGSIIKTTMMKI